MKQRTDKLITEAYRIHGEDIEPCHGKETLHDCVTIFDDTLHLWFNDKTGITRIITE